MNEILYSQGSLAIVTGLLLSMLASVEIGYRFGMKRRMVATEAIRSQVNAVLAAKLGLLALLLGFSFSLALQRYDDRSRAVVAEANALGTAYLRSEFLPPDTRAEIRAALRQYLEFRIRESQVNLTEAAARDALMKQTTRLGRELWQLSLKAIANDVPPQISALYLQSLNEVLDSAETRTAALDRHVPEVALILLFVTFMMTSATLGYASGVAGHRATWPALAMVILIIMVVYLVIDLDRPRRGLIRISHESLLSLRQTMEIVPDAPRR